MTLDEFEKLKLRVESTLAAFLDEVEREVESESPAARGSIEKLRWVIDAGGKRIRPIFCLLGNAVAGGDEDERILKVAASLELLHTFAIIHDDVMDRSTKRRGARTLLGELKELGMPAAVGMATLIGDLAFVLSERLFTTSGYDPTSLQRTRMHLDRMRLHAVVGQYLDLSLSGTPSVDVDVGRAIASLKTGSYTVEGPLLIGVSLARADGFLEEALARYGHAIGEAFQLQDDLSLLRPHDETGKDPLADLRQGRPMALIAEAFARSDGQDRDFLEGMWGDSSATGSDLDAVRRIVVKTGADEALKKLIAQLRQAGIDAIVPLRSRAGSQRASLALQALEELPGKLLT